MTWRRLLIVAHVFLHRKPNHPFDEFLLYLENFFGSKELLIRAIVSNPSLLTYDLNDKIKPAIAMFEKVGLPPKDLIPMLLSRPTLIPRCHLDDEKMGYIHRTGLSKESKMYNYVVTIFSVSNIKTIEEKVENLEGFGFSEDEVLRFSLHPMLLLMLSFSVVWLVYQHLCEYYTKCSSPFLCGCYPLLRFGVFFHGVTFSVRLRLLVSLRFFTGGFQGRRVFV